MDYKKASQVRKKGLLSLIAEKKFKEGEGLGSSIGSAISEKLKARALGIKEKFDPLNMLKAITGEGVIGRSIRTIGGRAMGRSDSDIEYFGGYRRSGKPGRKKLKEKKDPQFTTMSGGPIAALKSGDSIANILGKMYNFMQKTHERSKLSNEIEKAFRQEQLVEDKRRHKKVIDAILGKKDKAKPEDTGVKSFIKKLVENIKKLLGTLMSAIIPILTTLASSFVSFASSIASTIMSLLITPITSLIETFFKKFVVGGLESIARAGVAAVIGGPMSLILLGGLAAVGGVAAYSNYKDYEKTLKEGPEAKEIDDKILEKEQSLSDAASGTMDINSINETNKEIEELKKKRTLLVQKYRQEVLIPAMIDDGWEKEEIPPEKGGTLSTLKFKKDGKEATLTDVIQAIEVPKTKKLLEESIKGVAGKYTKEMENKISDALSPVTSAYKKYDNESEFSDALSPVTSAYKKYDNESESKQQEPIPTKTIPQLQDENLINKSLSPGEQVISMNKTNNFGGRESKLQYGGSTKVRDDLPQNYLIQVIV